MILTITYNNNSVVDNTDTLTMGIDARLTQYRSEEYVESIIVFTILMNININDVNLICSITGLNTISTRVFSDTPGIKVAFYTLE